jgi:hypothetical protein
MQKYHPDLTPIQALKLKMEMQADPTFKRIFSPKFDITPHIQKEAQTRYNPQINEENHNVWECYGLTGDGKSNGMLSLVRMIHPILKVENVFFHDEEILEVLPNLKRPDWIVRDENIGGAHYGSGSNRIKSQLEAVTQTLRKRCIGFTFIGTQPAELTTTQYIFRAIDKDRQQRITRFGVKDPLSNVWLGAIYIKVMDETDSFWVEYNARKERFMQSIIDLDFSAGKPQYQKLIDIILKDMDITKYSKKAERKLFISQRFTHLTKGEVGELAVMLEMQLRNGTTGSDTDNQQKQQLVQEEGG